jgi:hypothetical protein
MKFPKNRETVYIVVRGYSDALCGVFANFEDAEDYKGACEQEWEDKTGKKQEFYIRSSTFYG